MKKYAVKLMYIYSETIEVEAENPKDAIDIAQADEDIAETFEGYHDAHVTEIDSESREELANE